MFEDTPPKPKQSRRQDILVPNKMSWKLLEKVLKSYHEFKALVESEGIDEVTLDNGLVLNFWDLLRGIDELPPRQRQAVELMCLENMREEDAAKAMGYENWSSPAGLYKRQGLQALVRKYWSKEYENPGKDE